MVIDVFFDRCEKYANFEHGVDDGDENATFAQ